VQKDASIKHRRYTALSIVINGLPSANGLHNPVPSSERRITLPVLRSLPLISIKSRPALIRKLMRPGLAQQIDRQLPRFRRQEVVGLDAPGFTSGKPRSTCGDGTGTLDPLSCAFITQDHLKHPYTRLQSLSDDHGTSQAAFRNNQCLSHYYKEGIFGEKVRKDTQVDLP